MNLRKVVTSDATVLRMNLMRSSRCDLNISSSFHLNC